MKKPLFLVLWVITALPLFSQSISLTGKWVYTEERDSLFLEFSPKGIVTATEPAHYGGETETLGGENFVFETSNGDTARIDCKYILNPAKPQHLYIVLYKAGTDIPYVIIPVWLSVIDNNTIEIAILEADAENADGEGILYEGPKDWKLAEATIDETIAQLKNPDFDKDDLDIIFLKRLK